MRSVRPLRSASATDRPRPPASPVMTSLDGVPVNVESYRSSRSSISAGYGGAHPADDPQGAVDHRQLTDEQARWRRSALGQSGQGWPVIVFCVVSSLAVFGLFEVISSSKSSSAEKAAMDRETSMCEARVRRLMGPLTMVFLESTVVVIGGGVFLFLWTTYARAKKIPLWTWGSPQTVTDKQHPANEYYPTLPDNMLAIPRDSEDLDNILHPQTDADGEPVPELLVLQRVVARSPCLGGPAGCWCPTCYPCKAACWLISTWLAVGICRFLIEDAVRSQLGC